MLLRRTAMLTLSAGLLAPAMAGAANSDADVRAAYAAWDAAFGKSDAKAIGAMYADDALFLPPSLDFLKGPAAVEKFFTGLFAAGVTGHKLELIEAHGTPDLVVAAAMECAPGGGQIGRFELTPLAGLPEDGSHDEASFPQRRVQAAGR